MRIARPRTALLRTSSISDAKRSGDLIDITGLDTISSRNLIKINQFRYRAEVVKVETIGTSAPTLTASTQYIVEITDPTSSRESHSNAVVPRRYMYQTPADLTDIGATAALQREYVYGQLITKINDDSANNVVAVSLGSGTGVTITDDAGYYPAKTAGGISPRQGKSSIFLAKDSNNRGFVDGTHRVLTTDAVYQFGEGTRMASDVPVVYALGGGNIVAGEVDAPLTVAGLGAVAGQQYDAFAIEHLVRSEIPTIGEVIGYRVALSMIFVDNGLGSSVTNLAGFKAFEREMHKMLFSTYAADPKSVIEFFDKPLVIQGPLGAAPAGTADALGWILSPYGSLNHTNIGTQTIVAPVLDATGLLIDQDDDANDGAHYSANQQTLGSQQFVVGVNAFSVVARVVMGDWTDSHLLVGFRKKAAYAADYNDYTDLAAIGSGAAAGDTITTTGILNNAATVATASAVSYADGVSVELRVSVAIDGTVTARVNNVSYPIYSAGTTALVLDAGDAMIPFFQHVNIGSGNPAVSISEFVAVADNRWKVDA
ncbi:MAG: hypothetical protein IT212_07630 [Bacteroidia bacterium]|nr:hypothetical protein [Bacteroidia bacterium]